MSVFLLPIGLFCYNKDRVKNICAKKRLIINELSFLKENIFGKHLSIRCRSSTFAPLLRFARLQERKIAESIVPN